MTAPELILIPFNTHESTEEGPAVRTFRRRHLMTKWRDETPTDDDSRSGVVKDQYRHHLEFDVLLDATENTELESGLVYRETLEYLPSSANFKGSDLKTILQRFDAEKQLSERIVVRASATKLDDGGTRLDYDLPGSESIDVDFHKVSYPSKDEKVSMTLWTEVRDKV